MITKYEELMRGGNATEGKFIVKFLGESETISMSLFYLEVQMKKVLLLLES